MIQRCMHGPLRIASIGNELPRCMRRGMSGSLCHRHLYAASLRPTICSLLVAFAVVLGGCSQRHPRIVVPPTPLYDVQPGVWRFIDEQTIAASVYAKHEAEAYARLAMDEWRGRVRRRTEEVFIPWYSSYWTQQWIATKVAWYKLQYAEGEATPEQRLVSYLQEQFYTQVLKPVSGFVDPHAVMEETTESYLRELKDRLDPLPFEHRIPVDAFDQHLDTIPAIIVLAVPPQDASLYEVLQANDLSALPAYETLLAQMAAVNGASGPVPSPDRLHAVARRAVAKLVGTMALRGSATAASTLIGGFWGLLISSGSAAWSVLEHERDKPEMEAQLQENLGAALEVMWQDLVEDRDGGVAAVVHHMSEQIESALLHPLQTPLTPHTREPAKLF